jgi:hypothetical protein
LDRILAGKAEDVRYVQMKRLLQGLASQCQGFAAVLTNCCGLLAKIPPQLKESNAGL